MASQWYAISQRLLFVLFISFIAVTGFCCMLLFLVVMHIMSHEPGNFDGLSDKDKFVAELMRLDLLAGLKVDSLPSFHPCSALELCMAARRIHTLTYKRACAYISPNTVGVWWSCGGWVAWRME